MAEKNPMEKSKNKKQESTPADQNPSSVNRHPSTEQGGPKGPEPTRYGDWEIAGKCVDF
jgi:hypothetical protein